MSLATTSVSRSAEKRGSTSGTPAEQVLSQSQSGREVMQDFVPLPESLEWELGQQYLKDRGNKAFISDSSPVPFVINNEGTLSRNAADVFFTSLVEAEQAGDLEREIYVLELGIGVGLFARFFLDHFRDLARQHKKDFYDRLTYVAADKSERMLTDVLTHGVLANHAGHYRTRIVDAMQPDKELRFDVAFVDHPHRDKPLRAVFLNYLLDCLPAAVLELDVPADLESAGWGEADWKSAATTTVRQLCVRTCVARNITLADHTDMTLEQLQQRAERVASGEGREASDARQELLEVYGLFASEYDYRPVDVKTLPYGNFAHEYARRTTRRLLLSYGAIQCLEKLLGMVHDHGFILINDYGQTQISRDDEFEHQRFSLATFVGLNFPLLKAYFADHSKCAWEEPGDSGGIHSRLLARKAPIAVRGKFNERFGKTAHDQLQEPWQKGRECVQVGRFELASTYYNQALKRQPNNWVLLSEISMFLTFQLRDPKAGIDMAKLALALNPTCSADLWCTLGDGLYEFGRTAEARSAYQKALEVNESDVRARYNLAWVHTREKNYPAALDMIAQALALDKTGAYRDRLLQKQQEVLAHLTARNQQEYLLLINLVSKFAKKDDKPKEEPEKAE